MTMLKSNNKSEEYYISPSEYQKIRDMFNSNKIIDHCLFYDNNNTICLIAHGNDILHKIWFNGKWRTSEELSQLIRNELSITTNINIYVRIFSCYNAYVGGYIDDNTIIISAFYNKQELSLTYNSDMAKFAYVA